MCCCVELPEETQACGARLLPTTSSWFLHFQHKRHKIQSNCFTLFPSAQNHNPFNYVILFYYLLCALGNFHFNQDTGSIAKWQRMICKKISVGSLLKHVFRGWFGIARGNLLGEKIFSRVERKSWDMRERKEGK